MTVIRAAQAALVAGRSVGPFLLFEHFGPLDVAPGHHHDVRPHPHIGQATGTCLSEGAIAASR